MRCQVFDHSRCHVRLTPTAIAQNLDLFTPDVNNAVSFPGHMDLPPSFPHLEGLSETWPAISVIIKRQSGQQLECGVLEHQRSSDSSGLLT